MLIKHFNFMATTKSTVTAGDVISATRKYSNKDNEDRKYNITADVSIANGKVNQFSNGTLASKDEPSNGSANFSKGEAWISFNANNLSDTEVKEAFESIMDFASAVEESVSSK